MQIWSELAASKCSRKALVLLNTFKTSTLAMVTFQHATVTESYERYIHGTHVYPNPAQEELTVNTWYTPDKPMIIYDALGREVARFIQVGGNLQQ